jgi:hypothetical protein
MEVTHMNDRNLLEEFLLDIVNARVIEIRFRIAKLGAEPPVFDVVGTEDDTDRIFKRYSKFLPYPPSTPQELLRNYTLLTALQRRWGTCYPFLPKQAEAYRRGIVAEVRDRLRAVWGASDVEGRKERLADFQLFMEEVIAASRTSGSPPLNATSPQPDAMAPSALPPEAPLSQALAFLVRRLRLLKRCANRECPRPFIIVSRLDQKCCDLTECVRVSRSASQKLNWDIKLERAGGGKTPIGGPPVKESRSTSGEVQSEHPKVSERDIEQFVLDIVNADKKKIDGGDLYFFIHYPKFFPTWEREVEAVVSMASNDPATFESMKLGWPANYHRGLMRELHEGLRGVWQACGSAAGRLLDDLQSRTIQPRSHPVQQALQWVREHQSKLRRCRIVKCPSAQPFFVAKGKGLYCSPACTQVGTNKLKRESWGRHGQEWRENQAKKKGGHKSSMPKHKKL